MSSRRHPWQDPVRYGDIGKYNDDKERCAKSNISPGRQEMQGELEESGYE